MTFRIVCISSAMAFMASTAMAEKNFNRISSFAVPRNMAEGEDHTRETSAEIISASEDGMTLVYTDSPLGVIGLIDIADPAEPKPKANINVDGEPTAVSVVGSTAYVGVNTSESYTQPSGYLLAVDLVSGAETARCDLGGQPDSTAAATDGSFIAVAIENERDEDAGDGRVPQMPAGYLTMVNIADGTLDCGSLKKVDMTGLAEVAPEDPEPEFTDVNGLGEVAVTLQENNHIAIVSKDGDVVSHFSAGTVDLNGIDATDERGALLFTESQADVPREPDAVQWINDTYLVTANEGDMDGGSRGFTVFHKDGTVVYESGTSFEQALIEIGHYPDKRSDAKGVEPEGMEFARFGETPYVFLLSERGNAVGVYNVTDPANPVLKQILPSGIGPEGAVAIPERNLLVTANEADLGPEGGVRAHVMLYEYQDASPAYPTLTSAGSDELIGWGALSGMTTGEDGMIYAVNDSFYSYQPRIFKIDPSTSPARIVEAVDITRSGRPAQKLDLEGITSDGDGGFYIVSEGRTDRMVPHGIYHVNSAGEIKKEIAFPPELLAVERRFGSEGVTKIGDELWIAIQRQWGDDPDNTVKLVSYNLETEEWGAVRYPTEVVEKGWVGLSEIVAYGDYVYLIERDNQIGGDAAVKRIYRIAIDQLQAAPLGGDLPLVSKELVRDLIPDLENWNGYVVDKVEGLTVSQDGNIWLITDNDGVDDSSGETFFWNPGKI